VEDDELLGAGIRDTLSRAGYAVEWVGDGALACGALEHGGFDRLVTAFRLPDARTALLESLRAGTEAYASEPDLARSILMLAATDPDAAAAVRGVYNSDLPGLARGFARSLD